jgi:hypothetical protein
MGLLMDSVKNLKKMNKCTPKEVKRQIVIDELRALHVNFSRSGVPIDQLGYEELKEEYVIASILNIDIENQANKFF